MKIRAITALVVYIFFSANGFAQNGVKISGNVRDGDGNPIELVAVQIKNTLIGTITNEKGFYSLSISSSDSATLVFYCLGYNTAERIIPVADRDMRLNVQMSFKTLALGDITVTASRRQTTTMESINTDRIKLLPDPTGGSIESIVVTYAGVTSNNELSSQYSVRGGSYDENIVYVNGLEVFRPLLIRSGQQEGLSFVNPDLTESVNFSAGGFEAKYGDKMSSVLDVKYKKPTAFEGSVSASLLGSNVYIGSSTGKFTQVTGFRYKTGRSLLKTMDTDAEYDPNFIDLQTFMTYRIAPKWEVNFLGNMAVNNFKFTPYSRETSFGTTENISNFNVYFTGKEQDKFQTLFGALTLKNNPDEHTELGLQASAFSSREEESYDISGEYMLTQSSDDLSAGHYHEHARNKLQATIMNIGHYGSVRLETNTIQWGTTVQFEHIKDRMNEWERRDSAGYTLPHTGEDVHVYSNLYANETIKSTRISGYIQDAFKFRTRQGLFTLTGSVRGSFWNYNKEFIFSPRVSVGFIPVFNQDLTFRLATGLYYQPPFYKELRKIINDGAGDEVIQLNKELKSQRSIHFIAGGDYAFKAIDRNFKLTAEMYYKKLDNLNPYTIDNVKIIYYGENIAKGYAMGIDFKFFGEFVPGIDSWISFSLMKAKQKIGDKDNLPLPNSPGYNLSLFFQDYFPGYQKIKLNLRGVLSGRLPVTPPGMGYEDTYRETTPYRRVDMGMSYQLTGRYLKNIWIGVDVFNLFDIKNVNSYYWITKVDGSQYAVPNYLTGRQLNFRLITDF